ncbi:hypothetical protein RVIR1_06000 [Candidatus Rickettsiella viridis]|uniref:Uncharacterized protein n=1 Tax=Candidatus Rickettsiella viridis TaxID=676208 RepID=A0A2Z5UVQ1_9COXI|nr:hypothetical protein [Candidatus Rickettsiella viridis]BBB15101.1 hypothetical protein RVIR1_06000 [Candidatus Rickettsiella viridis]
MPKEKQPDVIYNDKFDAEYAEELKKAKANVKKFNELLKEEPLPETVNVPTIPKIRDANVIPLPNYLSVKIKTLLEEPLRNQVRRLAQEKSTIAAQKAGLLSNIGIQFSTLLSTLQTPNLNKDALLQAITNIRRSIIESQDKLSEYRSKWGSGFFFGTILRMDLTKRVTSKKLIDNLMAELDTIEKEIGSPADNTEDKTNKVKVPLVS